MRLVSRRRHGSFSARFVALIAAMLAVCVTTMAAASPLPPPRIAVPKPTIRATPKSVPKPVVAPAHETAPAPSEHVVETPKPKLGDKVRLVLTNAAYGLEANFVGTIATGLALDPTHTIHINPEVAGTFWILGTTISTLMPSVSRAIGTWWSKRNATKVDDTDVASWSKVGDNDSLYLVDEAHTSDVPTVKEKHSEALDYVKKELAGMKYGLKLAAVINAVGMPLCYVLYGTQFSAEGTGIFLSATLAAPALRNAAMAVVKKIAAKLSSKTSQADPFGILSATDDEPMMFALR